MPAFHYFNYSVSSPFLKNRINNCTRTIPHLSSPPFTPPYPVSCEGVALLKAVTKHLLLEEYIPGCVLMVVLKYLVSVLLFFVGFFFSCLKKACYFSKHSFAQDRNFCLCPAGLWCPRKKAPSCRGPHSGLLLGAMSGHSAG